MACTPKRLARKPDPRTRVEGSLYDTCLGWLAWAGTLTTDQFARLNGRSRRRAQQRLRALLDHGLVRAHLRSGALHHPNVYTLTRRGLERLVDAGKFPGSTPRLLSLPRPQRLAHALAIREVFTQALLAESTGLEVRDFRFEEDLAREPVLQGVGLVPDALAVLVRQGVPQTVGIEVDLGTEALSVLRKKFEVWRKVLGEAGEPLGLDRAVLLVVAVGTSRRTTLARLVAEASLGPRTEVVLLADLPGLLADGWPQRVFARGLRTERRAVEAEVPGFVALPPDDAGTFRPFGGVAGEMGDRDP